MPLRAFAPTIVWPTLAAGHRFSGTELPAEGRLVFTLGRSAWKDAHPDRPAMLIRADQSLLLVVDVQEKLVPAIHDGVALVERIVWLVKLAQRMGIPVAASEQYPQGLGPTVTGVRSLLPAESIASKVHFALTASESIGELPGHDRQHVVIAGMEAHVCVLQSACGLLAQGREVFVVADAIGSRRSIDRMLAIERLRALGASIVSSEMVAFEWLERAATPQFRGVLRDFLKNAGPAPQ